MSLFPGRLSQTISQFPARLLVCKPPGAVEPMRSAKGLHTHSGKQAQPPRLPHADPVVKWCPTHPVASSMPTLSLPPCKLFDHRDFYKTMDIVESASGDELRAVVLALCKDTPVMLRVVDHIKKLRDAQANASKTGEKRKASDQVFICVRCGEAFSEEANHSKACTYHHGKCAPLAGPGKRDGWPNLKLTNTVQGRWRWAATTRTSGPTTMRIATD